MFSSHLVDLLSWVFSASNGPANLGSEAIPQGLLVGMGATLLGVIGLLMAEKRNWQWARWTFKPLACAGFLLAGFALEASNSNY